MQTVQCFECRDSDPRWDEFVTENPQGTFFHLLAWRDILERNFGYKPFYLYADDGGEIQGVLPLFLVKSILFGRRLITIPLAVYGGPVWRTEEAMRVLLRKAWELANKLRVRHLEIRGNPYGNYLFADVDDHVRFTRNDLYVTFIQTIDAKEEDNLSRIPRKQRRMIRQGQKNGLRSFMDDNRLSECFRVYAESLRNLGTPVYGYRYFKDLKDTFRERCRPLLVEYQGRSVAGVLTFFYKDQILPYYGGSLPNCRHLSPNDFMYWQLISFGAANGYRVFDFGRSKRGSGSFDFKRHWGFEPISLPYFYSQFRGKEVLDTGALNRRLQLATKLWRRLPLRFTMALGPHIAPHLPW